MNESLDLVLMSLAVVGLSGLPGLLLARRAQSSQTLCTMLAVGGCASGLWGTVTALASGSIVSQHRAWFLPIGRFSVGLDALSCIFLLPVFVVSLVGSLYGMGYWRQSEHPESGPRLRFFYGLLTAALGLLVMARDGVLFLMAWELMALAAYFLVSTEDENDEVRAAGWLYLAASHLATLCLFGMFALLNHVNGTFSIISIAADNARATPAMLAAIFLLALVGFGLKAGIMPLHVWLPSAHASAPSHVSALMSGVLIKMGVYGLVRVTSLLPNPPLWWGVSLIMLGAISGILALALAIGQLDIKRTLAYSSIENIGVIFVGLGLALVGRSEGRPEWMVLGIGGALLHVWNHALFKSLLFYCAGAVIHATGTRSINMMGGLAKSMRWTSLAFLIGALAACALPPLNGFVSELLIYLGLFKTLVADSGQAVPPLRGVGLAAPALAMIGALAVACFVQLYGVVFLGSGRSKVTEHAHEAPSSMLVPLLLPIAGILLIGMAPTLPLRLPSPQEIELRGSAASLSVIGVIDWGIKGWMPPMPPTAGANAAAEAPLPLEQLAPLGWISGIAVLLAGMLLVVGLWYRWRLKAAPVGATGTWDCGYAEPTARMQYTSASFGQILVQLFGWILRPNIAGPGIVGLFPQQATFRIAVVDVVLNRIVVPVVDYLAWGFSRLRLLQQGVIQAYLLYIFLIIVVLLLWS